VIGEDIKDTDQGHIHLRAEAEDIDIPGNIIEEVDQRTEAMINIEEESDQGTTTIKASRL
jgi:hypothetical protein